MIYTHSAGGIIVNANHEVLLINERGRFWGFPKGTIEAGEDALTAAKREIKEETGLTDLTLMGLVGEYRRHPLDNHGNPQRGYLKTITLFLFTTRQAVPLHNDENNTTKWVPLLNVTTALTNHVDARFFSAHVQQITALL